MTGEQVPLALCLDREATFDNFWPSGNELVLHALNDMAALPEAQWMYLAGGIGAGVSHLLQATTRAAEQSGWAAIYFDLRQASNECPQDVVEGFDQFDMVAFDHVDSIVGHKDWELALFAVLNRLRESRRGLLCGARQVPGELTLLLPDLQSRLAWAACYHIREMGDREKIDWLVFMAKQRGLILSEDVACFILRRCARDLRSLVRNIDKLDKASMAHQKRLTVPFVKQVLGL